MKINWKPIRKAIWRGLRGFFKDLIREEIEEFLKTAEAQRRGEDDC